MRALFLQAAALCTLLSGCMHTPISPPEFYCSASRHGADGSFHASETSANWTQFRGAFDSPFADPPYISIRYAPEFQGNGDARTFRRLVESDVSIAFGRRFRERDLPPHRGTVRQHFIAVARVSDEAVSVGLTRDGWAFFPTEGAQRVLHNDGDLELALYDSHGRMLHREFVRADARVQIKQTLTGLTRQALEKARHREANCRLESPGGEVMLNGGPN
jgi:hypothetical protein